MKTTTWIFGKDGALLSAASQGELDLVRELVAEGAKVNKASPNGITPLHRAAQNGHQAVVKVLLESGADPTVKSHDQSTPASLAEKNSHREIVQLLSQWRAGR